MMFHLPRPRYQRPDRHALNWLLGTVVLVLANHVGRLPAWLSLLTGCLLVWRYLVENHGWRLPGQVVRLSLALALAIAIYKQFGTVVGRDAGIALLVGLLGLKFLELRRLRDYALIVFLCYFLVLGGFLYSQSLWVGAYMVAVTVVATATLIRINQPGNAWPDLRLAGELLIKALPLMLVLYLFFPRVEGSLWGLPTDAYSGLTGLDEELRPGSINQLSLNDETAFRVKFAGAPPQPKLRYWRAMVLTETDGRGWRRTATRKVGVETFERRGRPVSYTITLEPHNRRWLFALDLPTDIPQGILRRPGYVLETAKPVRQRLRYSLTSFPRYRTPALSTEERARNLRLPPRLSTRVVALAQTWRRRAIRTDGIVQLALRYFHDQDFSYTLKPPLLGDDPVDEFLFETRRGYCEHYASAFATLMRAAGVPSRVVVGYQGGEFNATGDYLIVSQADAHAWAEVWDAERGWVRVDPTAAVAPERIEYGTGALRRLLRQGAPLGELAAAELLRAIQGNWLEQVWRQLDFYWDAANFTWNEWVMGFSPERQLHFLRWLGFKTPSWLGMVAAMITGAVLCVLLAAGFTLYQRKRPDPVVRLYNRFCAKLARAGLRRAPAEGPLDFARRTAGRRPDLAGPIEAITTLYIRLRYGGHSGAEALRTLRRQIRAFRPSRLWKGQTPSRA